MPREQDGASVGVGPNAELDPPRACYDNLHVEMAAGQGEGDAAARNPRSCLRAEPRPVLVPCHRSGEAIRATPIDNEANHHQRGQQAPLAGENTDAVSDASSEGAFADFSEAVQPGDEAKKGGPCARAGVETTRHQLGSEAQGQGTGVVVASVRAGDWVLLNHCGGTNVLGGNQGNGWLRVEAVSVG